MTIHDGRGASRMYDGETENIVFYLTVVFLKVPLPFAVGPTLLSNPTFQAFYIPPCLRNHSSFT